MSLFSERFIKHILNNEKDKNGSGNRVVFIIHLCPLLPDRCSTLAPSMCNGFVPWRLMAKREEKIDVAPCGKGASQVSLHSVTFFILKQCET